MEIDIERAIESFQGIINSSITRISNKKPSEWTEQKLIMGEPFPGPYTYNNTPYCREIIDRLSPDDPAREVFVMKAQQLGISAGVLIPAVGWIIEENPGNTYLTVPSPALIDKASEKVDIMINSAGIRHLIRPQALRNKNQKTGDTNTKKDFGRGYLNITTPNNHREWRDVSLKYGLFDDVEAAMRGSKESGSTRELMRGRFTAYANSYKILWVSTPLLEQTSIIYPGFLLGDQRKWLVPCEHCGSAIELLWSIECDGYHAGITWKVDNHGKLIQNSVGYICQSCGKFFNDKKKYDFLNAGYWNPTAEPKEQDVFSYQINALYAPTWMYGWRKYVEKWKVIHPDGQPRNEQEYKTFVTTILATPYKENVEAPSANIIQGNTRPYKPGQIPEQLSMKDGNGRIVLITCAADMNGKVDDARLDYEIVAWSETGAVYSITHGSIGTFIPREGSKKEKVDREHWTYEHNKPNSVWPEFEKVISQEFETDTDRSVRIFITGLDSGNFTTLAYAFLDSTGENVVALKGNKEHQFIRFGIDVPIFSPGRERGDLYILQVGLIKDKLNDYMQLNWDGESAQPSNFMNFPEPTDGLYGYNNYFAHFESEHRVIESTDDGKSVAAKWEKKNSAVQNHLWDCRVYNVALMHIILGIYSKGTKNKAATWRDFADYIVRRFI